MAAVLKSSMIDMSLSSPEVVEEGARRATDETASGAARPDPEVVATARRRQYSASEKRALLVEADQAKARGELGAFLRRKRLYSSMLSSWRQQVTAAGHGALAPRKRGPKPDAAARQIKHLNRDIARLRRKLERAEIIIDAQKKLCVALGLPTSDDRNEDE
jgi:transposase